MHSSPKCAQTVAVATPCWPAPVSAMIRCLPSRRATTRLAERVVDLVRAGVQEVLALQVDAFVGREPLRARQRRGAAGVRGEQLVQLRAERRVVAQRLPRARQLVERRNQRLRDVAAAVVAERDAVIVRRLDPARAPRHDPSRRGSARSSAQSRPPRAGPRRSPRDVPGAEPARQHHAARCRAGALEVRRVAFLPGEVDDGSDALAAAQQHGVARAVAVLAAVELDEIRVGVVLARRRTPRRAAPSPARRAARRSGAGSPARG